MSKFLKWLDNYWYHYKWHTIIVSFFLLIGTISMVQIFNRETYDAYVMYVGDAVIPDTQYYDIMQSLKEVSSDYDENKEHNINFSKTAFITDPENKMASSINASAIQYLSNLVVQPYYIYLMDEEVYKLYKDSDIFVPISEIVSDLPANWYYDDTAVYFDRTDYANSFPGVDNLGENTLLVIKIMPYSSSKRVMERERGYYDDHLDMLKNILSYRKNG
ncbi:MAG: hypothetical protein IKM00_09645 [Clostridia bacterium]|nr:hypothetical protein [Clostridia bacterium]